jgi:hypothetical protein
MHMPFGDGVAVAPEQLSIAHMQPHIVVNSFIYTTIPSSGLASYARRR